MIQPGVDGLLAAGMIEERRRGAECDLYLTAAGTAALDKLTEARRSGLTELLEGWNPEEHPEIIEMVKDLAHSLLADDERLVADAMPHVAVGVSGGGGGEGAAVGGGCLSGRRPVRCSGRAGRASGEPAAPGGAPRGALGASSASRPMSAAPSTGGASRRTRTARGATAWTPAATRAWKAVSVGVEDAATQDDFDRLVLQVEPDDGGADEGRRSRRRACRPPARAGCVAVGGGVEEDAGELEQPGVGDGPGVDAGQRGLRVGRPELGRHPFAQGGGGAAAVAGPQGEAEGAQPQPGAAGREVPRQLGQRGKRTVLPSGPTAAQFMPVPQTTPMPQRRVVPARETANVSLRRMTRSVHPNASIAGASFSSSTGRSMPARQ